MDINCDLGEGIGNDAQIMPFISSCNIACGGHFGNVKTMRSAIRLAKNNNVKIGAHPSFPDRKNFGRIKMNLPKDVIRAELIKQIATLKEVAKEENVLIHHIKAHGALYNMAFENDEIATILVELIQSFDDNLILYVPFGSIIAQKAEAFQIPYFNEVFVDRNYNEDLTLVARHEPNAVIIKSSEIYKRMHLLVNEHSVCTINNKMIKIKVDTICVHGDNPNAVEIANIISNLIKNEN